MEHHVGFGIGFVEGVYQSGRYPAHESANADGLIEGKKADEIDDCQGNPPNQQ